MTKDTASQYFQKGAPPGNRGEINLTAAAASEVRRVRQKKLPFLNNLSKPLIREIHLLSFLLAAEKPSLLQILLFMSSPSVASRRLEGKGFLSFSPTNLGENRSRKNMHCFSCFPGPSLSFPKSIPYTWLGENEKFCEWRKVRR